MTAPQVDRLALARWEADRHAAVLGDALARWRAIPTPRLETIECDPALRQLTDQILFRFIKLQDAMGERLIPGTLGHLMEPFEDWPMRDRLDRLEKLGYVEVEAWLRWRELRNRLAHEYPDAPELRHAQLLTAIAGAADMLAAYGAWANKLSANA